MFQNRTVMKPLEYIDKLLIKIVLFMRVLCMYLEYKAQIQLPCVLSYSLHLAYV